MEVESNQNLYQKKLIKMQLNVLTLNAIKKCDKSDISFGYDLLLETFDFHHTSFALVGILFFHVLDQVNYSVGVPILIVIPRDQFHKGIR